MRISTLSILALLLLWNIFQSCQIAQKREEIASLQGKLSVYEILNKK